MSHWQGGGLENGCALSRFSRTTNQVSSAERRTPSTLVSPPACGPATPRCTLGRELDAVEQEESHSTLREEVNQSLVSGRLSSMEAALLAELNGPVEGLVSSEALFLWCRSEGEGGMRRGGSGQGVP